MNAEITLRAALSVSASTTPSPSVPSTNLIINGAPPRDLIIASMVVGEFAIPVEGIGISFFAKICKDFNLSLAFRTATELFKE